MKFYLVLPVVFLAACSGGNGVMDGIMHSWVGSSVDDVIARWGYPDGERTVAGKNLLVWSEDMQLALPTTTQTSGNITVFGNQALYNGASTTTGGGISNWNCTRIVEVNKANKVVAVDWKGNNCPFMEAAKYSTWRK